MEANSIIDSENDRDFRYLQEIGPRRTVDLLFTWLASDDRRRRSLAVEIMRKMGSDAVSGLVYEAMKPRQREQTKIRLLLSVAEIGLPLSRKDQEHIMMGMGLSGLALLHQSGQVFAEIGKAEKC